MTTINTWWEEEWIPIEATDATVASIYKKGGPTLPSNYRPIALLPVLYKVYASLIKHRMQTELELVKCEVIHSGCQHLLFVHAWFKELAFVI